MPSGIRNEKIMKINRLILFAGLPVILCACNNGRDNSDASGVFEAEEVIVSSELPGKILEFSINEGDQVPIGKMVAMIDATNLRLQKEQVEASIGTLQEKVVDVGPQVKLLEDQLSVQQTQLDALLREKVRFTNLVKEQAATQKQLDDITSQYDQVLKQMEVTRRQVTVQKTLTGTQNRSVLSERSPLSKRVAQLDDQIQRAAVINPVSGTVLAKYAQSGEITAAGKALYKIAGLDTLRLRAYITGNQLAEVKLNQQVKVSVDDGKGSFRNYEGRVTWISDKAEFTPKTIQTKEERANLVYAVKVDVKNDGYLKIGMYGELKFKP
jgi:HlyD family secretion protein